MIEQLLWLPYYALVAANTFFVGYYCFFAAVFFLKGPRSPSEAPPSRRFLVLVPAHNEEVTLPKTLSRIAAAAYPENLRTVVVIADNCADRTAAVAAAHDAQVLVRDDAERRGKGHALQWALSRLDLSRAEAVVVLDADTVMDPEFLAAMNNHLEAGEHVVQGYNAISNPSDNPLTELIQLTNVLKNRLFNEAKQRLGLPVSLMGTGMCFEIAVLRKYGWTALSIGEDWEYSALLAQAGEHIAFAPDAITYAEEARTFSQAFGQRLRWAGGKLEVTWRLGIVDLARAFRRGDLAAADAALNVIVPSYSMLANATLVQLLWTTFYPMSGLRTALLAYGSALVALQAAYLVSGLLAGRASRRTVFALLLAPLFLVWKLGIDALAVVGFRRRHWWRTARNAAPEAGVAQSARRVER